MPAESGDQRRAAAVKAGAGAPPLPPSEQQEHLSCPRCDSTNTKFCYYNNYNFSQPRHFCKSCRRYWTQGGTLRDIPVGGANRKSAKRSRTLPPPHTSSASPVAHFSVPVPVPSVAGSFTSLLNSSATAGSGGFLALGGLGLDIGPAFDDVAFGPLGRALWAFPEIGYFGSNSTGSSVGIGNGTVTGTGGDGGTGGGMSAWKLESGGDQAVGSGFVVGDCFPSWPELAISTPGNGLK